MNTSSKLQKITPSKQKFNVLFATSEIAPWVKTGGLGDVASALPAALAAHGMKVSILTPAYPALLKAFPDAPIVGRFNDLGAEFAWSALRAVPLNKKTGLRLLLLDCPEYYDRPGGPYQSADGIDWPDNVLRFGLFSRIAALLASGDSPIAKFQPNILHLNDWQSALAPAYLHYLPHGYSAATVLTVHNLAFQGNYPLTYAAPLGFPPHAARFDGLEHWEQLCFLKAGLQFAHQITTVSPTYAQEIQSKALGFGLADLLHWRRNHLTGILNGIDSAVWHPTTDPHIVKTYSASDLENKKICRAALRDKLGLTHDDVPIIGMVARLTYQKGADLVLAIADELVKLPAQLVLLGSGDKPLEYGFSELAKKHKGQMSVTIGFDEALAHQIEAGADMFLMPSRFEPCGLNQMYSLIYGTLPIVTATGGLADTVIDSRPDTLQDGSANGFVINSPDIELNSERLLATLKRACEAWSNEMLWRQIQSNGMKSDFGWTQAANQYQSVYERALATRS